MRIDPASQEASETYKLLTGLVVPRPVGWISSVGRDGTRNLAPFSFFNAICPDPPSVSVGIANLPAGGNGELLLYVQLRPGFALDDALRRRIASNAAMAEPARRGAADADHVDDPPDPRPRRRRGQAAEGGGT